tara:strand:- start:323 stop:490 length:168 start_codon:yes stop_codon:yes gene_type:complete
MLILCVTIGYWFSSTSRIIGKALGQMAWSYLGASNALEFGFFCQSMRFGNLATKG